jgi:putative phosphoribosyl transferase
MRVHAPAHGYRDRHEAGEVLACDVKEQLCGSHVVVVALPRGGVPIAYEVARELNAPLDICVVRKVGTPGHAEFALGAIAPGGVQIVNEELVRELGLTPLEIAALADRERAEIMRQEEAYRGSCRPVELRGATVVLVDDGLATGSTMRAAIAAVRAQHPQRVVVAVPVGAPEACAELAKEVDAVICPLQPEDFNAVGKWYEDFEPTSDEQVQAWLERATRERSG